MGGLRPVVNVFYFVPDLAAGVSWYRELLSTEPVEERAQLAMFQVGAARLTVHVADESTPVPAPRDRLPTGMSMTWTLSSRSVCDAVGWHIADQRQSSAANGSASCLIRSAI